MSRSKKTTKSTKTRAQATPAGPDLVPLNEMDKQKETAKAKKTSGLDAAAQVLKDAGSAMNCKQMVETMLAKGLWKTGGKTPAATLYSAIVREIQTKGEQARFKKADRGLFVLSAQ